MEEWFKSVFEYLLANYALYLVAVVGIIMAFIVLVLNLLKKPIKVLTSKIKNEKVRKLANKIIILLSFGLATGIWFVLNAVAPQYFEINVMTILMTGALPIICYAFGDGVLTSDKSNALFKTLQDIMNDGKLTADEAKDLADRLSEAICNSVTDKEATEQKADDKTKVDTKTKKKETKQDKATDTKGADKKESRTLSAEEVLNLLLHK